MSENKLDEKLLHESQFLENLRNELTILQASYGFLIKVSKKTYFQDEILDIMEKKLRSIVPEQKSTKIDINC